MSKTIMVSDEVHSSLARLKHPRESYTELLSRLAGVSKNRPRSILECAGLWSHLTEKDVQARLNAIERGRVKWRPLEW
ncbi:MAG: antitoxin VapB family protein [Candidatus Diapherotrites archaeon]|nr:antitoxin VapB family protein [Candidatus Diapherotrites archaeon]